MHGDDTRPWTFYAFAAFFTLFVLFLYGPMIVIYILSFQGPNGGMTFPLNGVSLHWFAALVSQTRVGDIAGSFVRSIGLAVIVAVATVVLSVLAGLAFRRRFRGSAFAFYLAIASLIMPGLFVGLGIALTFRLLGLPTEWYTTGLGAQLTWTLPFGLLIMFAVLAASIARMRRRRPTSARTTGRRCARSPCRSCCPASSAWRCSASPCPTTRSPALPWRPAPRTPCRSRSGR